MLYTTHLHALKAEDDMTVNPRKRSFALFNKTENPLLIARHHTSSMNFLTIVATYRLIISNFLVKIYLQNKQIHIVPALYHGSVSKLAVSLCFAHKTRYLQKNCGTVCGQRAKTSKPLSKTWTGHTPKLDPLFAWVRPLYSHFWFCCHMHCTIISQDFWKFISTWKTA